MSKTRDQIYQELHREYLSPEVMAEIDSMEDGCEALSRYLVLDLHADIDSHTIFWAQFANE